MAGKIFVQGQFGKLKGRFGKLKGRFGKLKGQFEGTAPASSPYYIGRVQHTRTMTKREAYAYLAQETGFRPAQLRSTFLGLASVLAATRRSSTA